MQKFEVMNSILFMLLVAVAVGGAGCDGSGVRGDPPPDPNTSEPLAVVWKHSYDIAGGVTLAPRPVGDSLVLFGVEARLVALRAEDGSVKWRSQRVEPSTLELSAYQLVVGRGIVFGSHVARGKAWGLKSGKELWALRPSTRFFEGGYYGVGPENFYASASGGRVLAIDHESGNITLDRSYQYGAYGLTYHDGTLYFTQAWTPEGAEGQSRGGIMKVDAATGDSLWGFRTTRGGFSEGSPIVEEGRVYAGTYGGKAAFFAVDAETGEEIWRNEDAPTFAPPAHGPERIYLNTSADVMALDKETGRTVWKKDMPGGSGFRGVAYLGGYAYHPRGGTLYVLDAATGEIVHREPSPSSYYWTLSAGPERIYAQASGHLIAYEPYASPAR